MTKNRLAEETSPYLLQHKDNLVHWWAWGPEALDEAKRTGKPILLSVGYAACHWCHVMAHESFEDEATAEVMNDLFINIKVDREERPDIDAIYMGALHRLGEQGGWPLTMFLAPDARPFFGGTYFPKEARFGRPAFVDVLRSISRTFHDEPEKVTHNADAITADLARRSAGDDAALMVSDELLADLTERMVRAVDMKHGGINGAPKFPQWSFFWLMWRGAIRYHDNDARKAVETTLVNICQGGIYDHLGGGFARYSTDERWLVPHFEKMLYDNALLLDLMTEVWRETRNPVFERRIAETVEWLKREMIADGGGFAASLDADSEGEEGRFYVWSHAEITDVLGAEVADHFSSIYDVQEGGNWDGKTILNRLGSLELLSDDEEERLAQMRAKLLERRGGRIHPGWDDKVLADWNGLMIAALARASVVFDKPDWLDLAKRAFDFVIQKIIVDGRMLHSYRAGRAKAVATASDYANMIWAAIRLHEATASKAYLDGAVEMTDVMHRHYWLPDLGRYATTADDVDDVIVRLAAGTDDATPNANAIQVSNLVHLAMLTGEHRYFEQATMIIDSLSGDAGRNLVAHTGLLANALDILSPQHIVVLAGFDDAAADQMRRALHGLSLPGAIEQFVAANKIDVVTAPTLEGKSPVDGKATAYACLGSSCSPPQTDPTLLLETLRSNRSARTAS